jgi:hypothetical protein
MTNNLAATIDALGVLRAQQKMLEAKEAELKESLGDLAPGTYEGESFSLTVIVAERGTLDMAAARKQLGPKWVEAHTVTSPTRTLRTKVLDEVAASC